jgi:hypothetical protein
MVALTWTSSAWISGCCAHQPIGCDSRVRSPIDIDFEKQTPITKRWSSNASSGANVDHRLRQQNASPASSERTTKAKNKDNCI